MRDFVVRALSAGATSGWLEAGGRRFRCALGRGGLSWRKREGDGTTPRGRWPIDQGRQSLGHVGFAILGQVFGIDEIVRLQPKDQVQHFDIFGAERVLH